MKDDELPERPWTEAQWEDFMKRADARSAKFGELLETLHDDPDAHAKIDHEMGWDKPVEMDEDFDRPELDEIDDEALAEADQQVKESEAALQKLAAYQFAMRAERQIRKILKPQLDQPVDERDDDERWGVVWIGAAIAAAKVAAGHAMGYDDEVLCGNIVNVRRGLAAVDEAILAANELQAEKKLSAPDAKKVLKILTELKEKLEAWIAELRARVWWE